MISHCRVFEPDFNKGILSKDNLHKLSNVLRLKEGDIFFVTNGAGKEAKAILSSNGNYKLVDVYNPAREANIRVRLFAPLIKGERFENLLEKAVQLGVIRITPFLSQRCVAKKPRENKTKRWKKIIESAMLQCGGCLLPVLDEVIEFKDLPENNTGASYAYFLHEKIKDNSLLSVESLPAKSECWLTFGPEGGFSEIEVKQLLQKKWQSVWLGNRLFRADTAPIVALSQLMKKSWFEYEHV